MSIIMFIIFGFCSFEFLSFPCYNVHFFDEF
nr:MAG TPA: hypothetical protein [Caudoviricetes sp.]